MRCSHFLPPLLITATLVLLATLVNPLDAWLQSAQPRGGVAADGGHPPPDTPRLSAWHDRAFRNRPLAIAADAVRRNYVANSSVEENRKGWDQFTSDRQLVVKYSRDEGFAADGKASLKQEIVDSTAAPQGSNAYWIYRIRVDPSWAGKHISASCETWTTSENIVPRLTL
ncbi:MAG: hypothetical protein QOF73_2186, partial [Thermomicrobiales bacterium]|nr:hypothetical protein [Thermomicrobiales bacterium]